MTVIHKSLLLHLLRVKESVQYLRILVFEMAPSFQKSDYFVFTLYKNQLKNLKTLNCHLSKLEITKAKTYKSQRHQKDREKVKFQTKRTPWNYYP